MKQYNREVLKKKHKGQIHKEWIVPANCKLLTCLCCCLPLRVLRGYDTHFFVVLIYTQSLCGFGPQTLVKQDTLQMLIALTTSIPAKARRFLTRSNSVLATKAMS